MKKLIPLIILFAILFVTGCCDGGCKDCNAHEIKIHLWSSWTCFAGLFLTSTVFWFRSHCIREYREEPIGFKIYHIILVAFGYVWILGFIFGIVMWFVTLVNYSMDEWSIEKNAFPVIRKICEFFNQPFSIKIKK